MLQRRRLPRRFEAYPCLRLLAALATASILGAATLSGCTSDGSDTGDGSSADLGSAPLDEYLAVVGGFDPEMSDAEKRALSESRQQLMQELTAECMAEQGFEYFPEDPGHQEIIHGPSEEGYLWGSMEYTKLYGYGIVPEKGADESYVSTPTDEYLDSMQSSEREAYRLALWGEPYEPADQPGVIYYPGGGCQQQAEDQVPGSEPDTDGPFGELVEAMYRETLEKVYTDPRAVQLQGRWTQCMAEAGYDQFSADYEARNYIQEKYSSAISKADPSGTLSDSGVEKVRASIRGEEIAIATADVTCKQRLDYDGVLHAIKVDLQQKFIEENREELDAWMAYEVQKRAEQEAALADRATKGDSG